MLSHHNDVLFKNLTHSELCTATTKIYLMLILQSYYYYYYYSVEFLRRRQQIVPNKGWGYLEVQQNGEEFGYLQFREPQDIDPIVT